MPAPREVVAFFRVVFLSSFVALAFLVAESPAQTSLNDIHIVPRETVPSMANSVAISAIDEGATLHKIKTDVKLVLVPVTVTDPMQRLVTGLVAGNFQLYEGKQPQTIRHF